MFDFKKELQHQNPALFVDANLKYICQELLQNYLNAESASKQPGNAKQNLIDIFDIFLNQIGLTTVEQNGRVIIEVDGIDLLVLSTCNGENMK